ncbi:MAG TPA: RsmD family RNA methyltransferase [Thermoplasmata archaeon]|nr:RsmD family RNA methyltransferase [Thermoplasmata archaeon]
MISAWVELSGEAPALAAAEAVAAAEALGGDAAPDPSLGDVGLVGVRLPSDSTVPQLAARLALAHRCLRALASGDEIGPTLERAGKGGGTAAVRRLGRPTSGATDGGVLGAGAAFKRGGGQIRLANPVHRYWLVDDLNGTDHLLEEGAAVDRRAVSDRRMPSLPFQRPVSLPPRFARAAANLARVRPGDRVVDPFVGTGALLAEAGLLGARLFGIDRDPEMVRGALRNLGHLGLAAEELIVGDAGTSEFRDPSTPFDAIVTDPPYGRASSTGGEGAREVVARVLPRWAERVRPGGRIVIVVPGPIDVPGPEWTSVLRATVRVHRSLTREFRVFERSGATATRRPTT